MRRLKDCMLSFSLQHYQNVGFYMYTWCTVSVHHVTINVYTIQINEKLVQYFVQIHCLHVRKNSCKDYFHSQMIMRNNLLIFIKPRLASLLLKLKMNSWKLHRLCLVMECICSQHRYKHAYEPPSNLLLHIFCATPAQTVHLYGMQGLKYNTIITYWFTMSFLMVRALKKSVFV